MPLEMVRNTKYLINRICNGASTINVVDEIKHMSLFTGGQSVITYRTAILSDARMSEQNICKYILKGLNPPSVLRQISVLENSSLKKLNLNIDTSEKAAYLIIERLGKHNY